jgi:hypothetical protein
MAVLGGVFTASCAVFYLVLGSWVAAVLSSRPMAARAVSRVSGGGMFLIGAGLIAERVVG